MATPVLTPKAASSSRNIRPSRSSSSVLNTKLSESSSGKWGVLVFGLLLVGGLLYIGDKLSLDLASVHPRTIFPFILLGVALLIALGFEFVNGFLDTANAVATVIYTHSLDPHVAVVFSGILNFVGVLLSSGAVAFAIIGLLPVELLLKISHGSGFSMVFAVLIAAIVWNLATWWKALPVSSSHTMIGSILGVALAYQFTQSSGTAALDWNQIKKVLEALLISPVIGFIFAALVLILFKLVARDPRLYKEPEGTAPPPFYIRALLVLTCGGVSYAHGSNDGQKGMGLIMLILVGTVPTAFALNHHVSLADTQGFAAISTQASTAISHYYAPPTPTTSATATDAELKHFISTRTYDANVLPALQLQINTLNTEIASVGSLSTIPPAMQPRVRNQMYLSSETLRLLPIAKNAPHLVSADTAVLSAYRGYLDRSTRYIPIWVKVAVALALGLGTMVGWKRIVVTVGEKIGKTHLTYAQGAAAQLVAMCTILVADTYGLPVSTTHVLNSGIAGTMTANGSGLQWTTIRNIVMAWVFTLPAAALLSGCLFYLFNIFVH
ncbi:MAG: inorganic phosphate transporter [Acidobacteriaceae bacterium]